MLGLPSVCATAQSACPECPVPPPPYLVLYRMSPSHGGPHHGLLTNRCPLRGPPARTAQCWYRCAARMLGLPSVCATAQYACPDCPVPPSLPVVSTITAPVVPAGPVALVRNLGLPFPSPGSRLAGPLRPTDTPTAPGLPPGPPAATRSWFRHGAGPSTWPALQADGPRRPMGRITQR